ncbi:MAG TPA: AMP-binding protein [Candidatus Binataceae bacterium]|nr:AMP-binding protein [Candidatus Binataceae bacterium]
MQTEPFDNLDRLSSDALNRWWARKLKRALQVASKELPFYRDRFEAAGFDPSRFALADLNRVPISTKKDLLAAGPNSIVARAETPMTVSLSSGTAGTTFVMHTRRWRKLQGYASSRAHWWAGLRRGTPLIMSAPAWHAYASIQPAIAMHFECPCVVVSGTFLPRFADRIVDAIGKFHPRFLTMFLPMVFSIIAAAQREGLSAGRLFDGIETLVVTGAPITPGMRMHLHELTKVQRVTELAGSSENLLAVECVHAQGLHVVPDTCYVEVIDRQSGIAMADKQRGAVVHSGVIAEGSLYLRYDGGDVGTIDRTPCPCGLPSPRMKLLGRWDDCFTLGARTLLPYDVQLALESDVPELRGTAFVISKDGLADGMLRLLLVEPDNASSGVLAEAKSKLMRRFEVPVELKAVANLPLRFKGVPPILSEREAALAV